MDSEKDVFKVASTNGMDYLVQIVLRKGHLKKRWEQPSLSPEQMVHSAEVSRYSHL